MTTLTSDATLPDADAAAATDAAFARYRAVKYFGSLDGIRCLSIVAVLWHHAAADWSIAAFGRGVGPARLAGFGFLGVDVFFTLSGYLIATLLLRERQRRGTIDLKSFYIRRSLRIFPIYYGLLAGVALLYLVAGKGLGVYLHDLPSLATYTADFRHVGDPLTFHAWSLSVEEQFYLVWPPLLVLLAGAAVPAFLLPFLLVNQLVNFGLLDGLLVRLFGEGVLTLHVFDTTFTPIILGVCLAHVLHARGGFGRLWPLVRGRWSVAAYGLVLLGLMCVSPRDISGGYRLLIHLAIALFLAAAVAREDNALARPLSLPFVRRVGVVSYGMYLYHMVVLVFASVALGKLGLSKNPGPVLFVVTCVGTYLVSEASWFAVERPLLKFKERFKVNPVRAGVPAAL